MSVFWMEVQSEGGGLTIEENARCVDNRAPLNLLSSKKTDTWDQITKPNQIIHEMRETQWGSRILGEG